MLKSFPNDFDVATPAKGFGVWWFLCNGALYQSKSYAEFLNEEQKSELLRFKWRDPAHLGFSFHNPLLFFPPPRPRAGWCSACALLRRTAFCIVLLELTSASACSGWSSKHLGLTWIRCSTHKWLLRRNDWVDCSPLKVINTEKEHQISISTGDNFNKVIFSKYKYLFSFYPMLH